MKLLSLFALTLLLSVTVLAQVTYNAPTGHFSVTFPAQPEYSSQDLEVQGMNVTMRSYFLNLDTASYYVAEVTYPESFEADSDVQDLLRRSAHGFFAEFELEEGEATTVYSGNIEGAEYQQQTDLYGISYRAFFYKNTLIQMAAMGYNGYLPDSDLRSFFTSLKINL